MEKYSDCFDEKVTTQLVNGQIDKQNGCYGYCFINKGDVGVTVNQTYLLPRPAPGLSGESYAFVDPQRKLWGGSQFTITFDAGGAAPRVEIHQYHHVM